MVLQKDDKGDGAKIVGELAPSRNQSIQQPGTVSGSDASLEDLVNRLDGSVRDHRRIALDVLILDYKTDPRAVDLVLALIEPPRIATLTAAGRINALYFLKSTDPSVWTSAQIKRADIAIANMRARHTSNVALIGEDTRHVLDQLVDLIDRIKTQRPG